MGWQIDITWIAISLTIMLFGGLLYIPTSIMVRESRERKRRIKAREKKEIEQKAQYDAAKALNAHAEELHEKKQRNQAEHLNWMVQFHYAEGDSNGS